MGIRTQTSVSSIAVSAPSTKWLSLLYKDGLGSAAAVNTQREFWLDESGALHVLVAFVGEDGEVVAANSKHFVMTGVVVREGEPAVASTKRNWVNVSGCSRRELIYNDDGEASLLLVTPKNNGDVMDVFTGKFYTGDESNEQIVDEFVQDIMDEITDGDDS